MGARVVGFVVDKPAWDQLSWRLSLACYRQPPPRCRKQSRMQLLAYSIFTPNHVWTRFVISSLNHLHLKNEHTKKTVIFPLSLAAIVVLRLKVSVGSWALILLLLRSTARTASDHVYVKQWKSWDYCGAKICSLRWLSKFSRGKNQFDDIDTLYIE